MAKRRNEHLDEYKFKTIGSKPMGKKPVGVRVSEKDYEDFMQIPKDLRSKLLREFISDTAKKYKEGLLPKAG